jgi:hypothetical protein
LGPFLSLGTLIFFKHSAIDMIIPALILSLNLKTHYTVFLGLNYEISSAKVWVALSNILHHAGAWKSLVMSL